MAVQARRRASAPAAPRYTEADVRAQSASRNEPVWLLESRLVAWELYQDMPMPGLSDEEWRRTDYRHIRWEEADQLIPLNGTTVHMIPPAKRPPLKRDHKD